MLTVPVSWGVRAAANGLGSLLGLGLTAQEISDRERVRLHEAAMRNAANATGSGGARPGGGAPPAALPPGTVKGALDAAGAALTNIFGTGPVTAPPGTTTDAGEDIATTATPPISSAPNWGLYVGLAVAAVAGVALIAVITKKPAPAANRRRGRRRNGGDRWYVKANKAGHVKSYYATSTPW